MRVFQSTRRHLFAACAALFLFGATQAQTAVRVGSKIDTEGSLLGNVIVLVLEAQGIKTENKLQLGATKIVRGALTVEERNRCDVERKSCDLERMNCERALVEGIGAGSDRQVTGAR